MKKFVNCHECDLHCKELSKPHSLTCSQYSPDQILYALIDVGGDMVFCELNEAINGEYKGEPYTTWILTKKEFDNLEEF